MGGPQSIAESDDWIVYDALADRGEQLELMRRIDEGLQIETETGHFSFHVAGTPANLGEDADARAVRAEQSNSSIVFDNRLVLKVFRKLEPGINPELEMLRFLTKQGFPNIAPLQGWYEYEGEALASTLGVSQAFLADARDGWEMALDLLESDPDELLARLAALGVVTAELHDVLASDAADPAFAPEQPSYEALSLLTATVDEDIERIFVNLPDDERLEPIVGRGQDIRERLATRAQIGEGGRAIRIHGDYHLGQTLYRANGWVSRHGRCPSGAARARRSATSRACSAPSRTSPQPSRSSAGGRHPQISNDGRVRRSSASTWRPSTGRSCRRAKR